MQKSLNQQAEEILSMAEQAGVQSNFFFVTTFKRYQVQMNILAKLEQEIISTGMTVKKTYVKGRENVCANPAIDEYNKTATAANGTVSTLITIIRTLRAEDKKENTMSIADTMAKLLDGIDDDPEKKPEPKKKKPATAKKTTSAKKKTEAKKPTPKTKTTEPAPAK